MADQNRQFTGYEPYPFEAEGMKTSLGLHSEIRKPPVQQPSTTDILEDEPAPD